MDGMPVSFFKGHNVDVRRRGQNSLAGFNFPVAGVDDPHCRGYRAFHSRHQIDPLADAGILFEVARINHIHAAGVGDIVVNHHHFTVLT